MYLILCGDLMRKKSKILAVLTALILILTSAFSLSVFGAGARYYPTNASGAQGDTVTVSVKLSSGVALWGSLVTLKFNSSELQYVSSSKGGLVSSGSLNKSGSSVVFAGSLNDSAKNGGTIFTVKFKILKDSGSSALTVVAGGGKDNCDYNGNAVAVSGGSGSVSVSKNVQSVKLDKTSVEMKKGDTVKLNATVTPSDATNGSVKFTSSNTRVASVNSSGVVTAKGGGYATITASAGGKTATCKIFVPVKQTGIALSGKAEKTVMVGNTLKLSVSKVPADATDNHSVSWSSSDNNIVTVDSKGNVKGIALGTAVITASCNGWTVKYTVTVTENTESTSVTETDTTTEVTGDGITGSAAENDTTTENTENSEAAESGGFINKVIEKIKDKNDKISPFYHYAMVVFVFLVTAGISVPVTFFVTSSYYKNKAKKDEDDYHNNNLR